MCRSSFRIRVDLSKIYSDARRMSRIYVDKDTITYIHHVQNHISKIFDIHNPFYLLLNTSEYLPPNEDSRILRESDTLIVVPGMMETTFNLTTSAESNFQTPVAREMSAANKEDRRIDSPNATNSTSERTVYLSLNNDSQMDSNSESPAMDQSNLTDNFGMDMTPLKNKRKRVRRKKSKIETSSEVLVENVTITPEMKKPKIINSRTVPSGKHIRFSELHKEQNCTNGNGMVRDVRKLPGTISTDTAETDWNKSLRHSAEANLTALLSLRQSSTPITFAKKQVEKDQENMDTPEAVQPDVTKSQSSEQTEYPLVVDPKKHPLETKARINDVVKFKMLKMSHDYTPEVSDYIVAQLIQFSSDTSMYTFKILEGKDQIQEPQGKFDLESDEVAETDTIELTWAQLLEPRIISSK